MIIFIVNNHLFCLHFQVSTYATMLLETIILLFYIFNKLNFTIKQIVRFDRCMPHNLFKMNETNMFVSFLHGAIVFLYCAATIELQDLECTHLSNHI